MKRTIRVLPTTIAARTLEFNDEDLALLYYLAMESLISPTQVFVPSK